MGRRCYPFLLPQSCCLVVHGVDDGGKYEARPVVVELDELPTPLRGKMKIPSTEKANLRPPELHDRRRLAQGSRLPGVAAGNKIKGSYEIRYLGEDGGRDDLRLRNHREFCRHLWHPGSLQLGVEVLRMRRLEPQAPPRSLHRSTRVWTVNLRRPLFSSKAKTPPTFAHSNVLRPPKIASKHKTPYGAIPIRDEPCSRGDRRCPAGDRPPPGCSQPE